MRKKLLLDVDTGIDDALGIILAVKSEDADLIGITTVNGNVSLDQATTNTLKVLALLGAHYPVVKGANTPLIRPSFFEHSVHGEDGLGGALTTLEPNSEPTLGFAPDYMIEQAKRYPGELTLVMTGPLTNLALAIKKDPELVHLIKQVVYMGGAAFTHGNVTPVAEYNMYVDPEAARVVLHAGFSSITQIGLDVTRDALLTRADIASLPESTIKHFIADCTKHYMERYELRNGVAACALHDPLAVAYALNPDLTETAAYFMEVETNSRFCDGQTICDRQNRLEQAPNAYIALNLNANAFLSYFLTTIQH